MDGINQDLRMVLGGFYVWMTKKPTTTNTTTIDIDIDIDVDDVESTIPHPHRYIRNKSVISINQHLYPFRHLYATPCNTPSRSQYRSC